MVDARVIFYWSDMLAEAGIAEEDAFASPQQMEATLSKLQSSGIATPWVNPTEPLADIIHNVASWVWSSGGDFLDANERVCLYSDERTLEGIQSHFRLHRFMPHPDYPLDENSMTRLFEQRQCAAAICGPYFGRAIRHTLPADRLDKVRVALPPGPPFSGGSYLVIMSHLDKRFETAAIDWIGHLMSTTVQKEIYQMTGLLPARMEAMHSGLVLTHQHDRMYAEAVLRGKHLPSVAAWDTIEPTLIMSFASIHANLNQQPGLAVNDVVAHEMKATEARLNSLLDKKI
jgi:ABC-type glycerol-3-phosphate transport system substrate-binding protein